MDMSLSPSRLPVWAAQMFVVLFILWAEIPGYVNLVDRSGSRYLHPLLPLQHLLALRPINFLFLPNS